MPVADVVDASWAIMVDGYNGWIDPQQVRGELDEQFRLAWPDRETWGQNESASGAAAQGSMDAARATRLTDEQREQLRRERDERRQARGTVVGS